MGRSPNIELSATVRKKQISTKSFLGWCSGWIAGRTTLITVLAVGLLTSTGTLIKVILEIKQPIEIGYADSYILYDVNRYVRTGIIYKDLSNPPYNATQYGPLLYWVLGKTAHIGGTDNPFLGPRLAGFAAWIGCIVLVGYLSSKLLRVPYAGAWGALLAFCIPVIEPWILRLRCDFFGIFFGLLAIICLHRKRYGWVLSAGCFAGLAIVFKMTLIAALSAGALWLLCRQDWRRFLVFLTGAAIAIGTILGWFLHLEPRMLAQMTSLRPVIDVRGAIKVALEASTQYPLLLMIVSLPLILMIGRRRWGLTLLFCGISLAVGAITVLQAGAGINYFFEALWAVVPLAILTLFRMLKALRRKMPTDYGLAGAIILLFLIPAFKSVAEIPDIIAQSERDSRKMRSIESVVRGRKVASTIPRLALVTREPPITEPYMISYQLRSDSHLYDALLERLRKSDFELVVTGREDATYRGISPVAPEIKSAISSAYDPYCVYGDAFFHLPRRFDRDSALVRNLSAIGCRPVVLARMDTVVSWWEVPSR